MKRISDIIVESLPTASQQNTTVSVNALAVLKPGFLQYSDEFENILNANGFQIVRKKQTKLSKQQAQSLYRMHKNKDFFVPLCDYMTSDNIICYDCHKDGDNPTKEMNAVKDKVRKMWGPKNDKMKNVMHSPEKDADVQRESRVVFGEGEGISESMFDHPVSKEQIVMTLKSLYAEELFAFYNYFVVKEFLIGHERPSLQKKFEELAEDELNDHATKLLKRINELNDDNMMLNTFDELNAIAKAKYQMPPENKDTLLQVMHNIQLEEGAISNYKHAIMMAEDAGDFTTSEMLKDILADEEEHLSELSDFRNDIIKVNNQHTADQVLASAF